MPSFKLSKDAAIKLYIAGIGMRGNRVNIYAEPCKSGHIITVTDIDDIPVDRVLVRYDTKIFRNNQCVYEGTLL